jgi:hypothetical protein
MSMPELRGLARWVLPLLLSACSSALAMEPFTTDGCSMFPDRALIGNADWCRCCLAHDLAYWRGGTDEERLNADRELQKCVREATGNAVLADAMFAGVRTGGGPYFVTPYRWGYGWKFGRLYTPLSDAEQAEASVLRAEYVARNPTLACTK